MKKSYFLIAFLTVSTFFNPLNAAQTLTVITPGDSNSSAGGSVGDLRYVLNTINQGATDTYTVNFNLSSGQETIVLQDMLPLLNLTSSTNTLIINGENNGNQIVLDGNSATRGFFARQGNVAIQNITIQNTLAKGGNGGTNGGGGMGAGSALFIDQASVSLSHITMLSGSAVGGDGGSDAGFQPGGGGGMGGNGGEFYGGGGGLGGNGGQGNGFAVGAGGGGIGPGGNGGNSSTVGNPGGGYGAAPGGDGYDGMTGIAGGANAGGGGGSDVAGACNGGGGVAGEDAILVAGGNGGYGGGGGGFGNSSNGSGGFGGGGGAYAGNGGFGGGGGGGAFDESVGVGGFGGGGGGGNTETPGSVGGEGAGDGGDGTDMLRGVGGAGAGLGGAIFVNSQDGGTLTVDGPMIVSGGSAIGGTGANAGAGASAGIFSTSGGGLLFNPANNQVVTIVDSIGDNSLLTLPTGQSYNPGEGIGATLTKQGAGTLNLQGVNTYAGLTTVDNGELNLTGSIAADILVQSSGVFSGTGTVGGNSTIDSGGTISPGNNAIGTINILGNHTQNAGSAYYLEIDGAGNSDLINITGTATLNGGQVVVTALTGTVLLNTPYLILTAAEGVTGQFSSVIINNPLLTAKFIYELNNVYVIFEQAGFHFEAVTCNQIAVAKQLEGITEPISGELLILETLAGLSPTEQQHALNQISGEQYASLNQASEIAGRQFIRRLYDPIRSIVTTRPVKECNFEYLIPILESGDSLNSFPAANGCYYAFPLASAEKNKRSWSPPTFDAWFEVSGGQSFLNGDKNARGFKLSGYEVTTGFQSTFCHDWTIGLAGSYTEDHIDFDIGNNGKNRMGFGALYSLYRPSNFYILANLAFGYGQFAVNRSINIGSLSYNANSRPTHYQAVGYIEGGFDLSMSRFLVQPFLGFEGGYFRRNAISESGTSLLNLSINKQTYNNVYSRLGVHMTTEHWKYFKLSCDLAWDYRLTSIKRGITEHFQSFGNDFKITGISQTRNSVDIALTGIVKLYGGWELYLESEGEFWANVVTYNVLGGVKYSW